MFAGEFAAGAGAAESRFGLIDLYLIGLRSAALAFAPQHCLGSVQGRPFAGNHQTFGGLGRGCIGRELQNFVNAKRHERDSDHVVGLKDELILSGFWREALGSKLNRLPARRTGRFSDAETGFSPKMKADFD